VVGWFVGVASVSMVADGFVCRSAGGCVAGGGVLSPASFDFSHDEGFDSEDDSDHYEDYDDSDSGE